MVQTLTRDIQHLKQGIREFIDNEVEPHAMLIEETNEIPQRIMEKSKQMGLFALSIPEEYGGVGFDLRWVWDPLREGGGKQDGRKSVLLGRSRLSCPLVP